MADKEVAREKNRETKSETNWKEIDHSILAKLDLAREAELLGVKMASTQPNSAGWLACHAVGREDVHPSASINVGSSNGQLGKYVDKGTSGQRAISFWELAAKLGRFADFREARRHYADIAGVELPTADFGVDQIEWTNWDETTARVWCELYKPGVKYESLVAAGAKLGYWPKRSFEPQLVIGLPAYSDPAEAGVSTPANWVLYRADGRQFPEYKTEKRTVRARKVHTLRGRKDGWIVVPAACQQQSTPWDSCRDVWRCEGPPDALAIASILPEGHVAVSNVHGSNASASGLIWSSFARKLFWSFGDLDEAGQSGAESHAAAAAASGALAEIVVLPGKVESKHGFDVRDWINAGNTFESLACLERKPVKPAAPTKPKILITTRESEVAEQSIAAIASDPDIFCRAGKLVRIEQPVSLESGEKLSPKIAMIPMPFLRDRLSACVDFVRIKMTKDSDEEIPAHVPDWLVKAVDARPNWHNVRPLEAVIETPTIRKDGTIVKSEGYDLKTGIYYRPLIDFGDLPESPTRDDARAAAAALCAVACDFPFDDPAVHQAAYLAAILSLFARFAYDGPTPLFLVDANTPGSGKGLLCDLISEIATGRPLARTPLPREEEEIRKKITSTAVGGDRMVLLDNISGRINSPCLDAVLTSVIWKDRMLGRSENSEMSLKTIWFATGNNLVLGGDLSRRVCLIRLRTDLESPETRSGFQYPDLLRHVRAERRALATAAITILRAYFASGAPSQNLPHWGSYESWSNVIRSAVYWVSGSDPYESRKKLNEVDESKSCHSLLIEGLLEIDPSRNGKTSHQLLESIRDNPGLFETLEEAISLACGSNHTPRVLGAKIGAYADRVKDGKAITKKIIRGKVIWRVIDCTKGEKLNHMTIEG